MIYEKLKSDWKALQFANTYIVVSPDIESLVFEVERFINDYIFIENNNDLINNPDYLILTKEIVNNKEQKYINIAQARMAIEFFSKTSWTNQNKVLLIYKAENMNDNSANALLKLLEDTPKNSYIFLLVSNINLIIETIRSRSRIIYDEKHINKPIIEDKYEYLNLLIDYNQKDIEKFLKEIDLEDGKKLWQTFTHELQLALHNILLSIKGLVILSQEETDLKKNLTYKTIDDMFDCNKKIANYIADCHKYDLSKRHVFYLIAETIRY
jgi:DNA polymerase-3 subunit delta'